MTRIRTKVKMGFDTWDPILLPVENDDPYGELYDVDAIALARFTAARKEFDAAFEALHKSSVKVHIKRHGARS